MLKRTLEWIVIALLLLTAAVRGQLLGGGGLRGGIVGGAPVTIRAAVSAVPLLPGGEGQVVVAMTINPRYHVQSAFADRDKGFLAAGLTLTAVPAGVTAGVVLAQKGTDIPTPPALGAGTMSVYEGTAYFLVPLQVTADAAAGERVMEILLETQACTDTTCDLPQKTPLQVTLEIGQAGDAQAQPDAAVFAAAHARQFAPQPLPHPSATPTAPGPNPIPPGTTAGTPVSLLSTNEQLAAIAQRPYHPFNAGEGRHSLAVIFLFALLGGLILNVMPCVLPVIPLKALAFIQQAHGNPRLALLHGVTFSAGIVTLFVMLAVVLRVFGLFYGQQFQSPAFLITMVMFVVALALSMLGVWTIQPPRAVYSVDDKFSHRAGYLGSFSSGLMATLLATPCSAPFLGPVFAWALVQPAWLTAGMMAIVGVGMALPYLVLAFFPQALGKIPRAGRWSELLKQGLGIVMLGVAIYLVTLVPSTRLWPWVLAGTIVSALTCWGWGQIPTPLMTETRIWTIRAVVLALGVALGLAIYRIASVTRPATVMSAAGTALLPDKTIAGDAWLPFNLALLDQAIKDGRPVLVDWTADWCINCRVLEAAVLSRADLRHAVISQNAVLLRADLSQENPSATALNEKLGSQSIPVLAIFAPSRPNEPVVLRDSYSASRVIREIELAR